MTYFLSSKSMSTLSLQQENISRNAQAYNNPWLRGRLLICNEEIDSKNIDKMYTTYFYKWEKLLH